MMARDRFWRPFLALAFVAIATACSVFAEEKQNSPQLFTSVAHRRLAPGATPENLLALDCHESTNPLVNKGLVTREIVRQAVLIAGRDELGLQTRDVVLGEQFPDSIYGTPSLFKVLPKIHRDGSVHVTLFRKPPESPEILWRHSSTYLLTRALESLTTEMELQSRTSLPEAISKAGLAGKPTPFRESGATPGEIENALNEMTVSAQFHAVRSLHALIRKEGASPQRLSALARGYSHLGLLTEVHFNSAQAAYKARALLYAERALRHWPDAPDSYWTRGYVRTVVGMHAAGLRDFETANQLAEKLSIKDAPTWSRWAKLAASGDSELHEVGPDERGVSIARVLALVQIEQFRRDEVTLPALERLLESTPDCFRGIDYFSHLNGLANRNMGVRTTDPMIRGKLYDRLASWDDLPTDSAKVIAKADRFDRASEQEARIELIKNLHAAGLPENDTGELSWSALASLIEEVTFNQVRREVELFAVAYGAPADEIRKQREPLISKPEYKLVLQLYADDPVEQHEAIEPLMKAVDRVIFSWRHFDIASRLGDIGQGGKKLELYRLVDAHLDPVLSDLCVLTYLNQSASMPAFRQVLIRTCPNTPHAVISDINVNWETSVKAKADQYQKKYWNVAPVLSALAEQHRKDRQWDKVTQLLLRQTEIAPDLYVYTQLSELYRDREEGDRWKDILDEYIKTQPQRGLNHSQVQNLIAERLMADRRWEEAQKYAEQASRSGAAGGMISAAGCAEAQHDWATAERYYAALARRYRVSSLEWYFFCRRTGKGHIDEAKELLKQYTDAYGDSPYSHDLFNLATLAELNEDAKTSLEATLKYQRVRPTYMHAIQIAALAHETGQTEVRDLALKSAGPYGTRIDLFVLVFKQKAAKGGPIVFDSDQMQGLAEGMTTDERMIAYYCAGRLAAHAKQKERAIEFYKQVMNSYKFSSFVRTQAGVRLLELGVKPEDYKDLVLGKEAEE